MRDLVAGVVVTYNRKALLEKCLSGLLAQSRPLDRIFIVDNASSDGTDETFSKAGGHKGNVIEYVRLPENVGGAGGFHAGMELASEAGYDWIWLMDDDAFAHPDALQMLLAHEKEADILVSVQLDSAGRPYGASEEEDGAIVPLRLTPGFGLTQTAGFSFVGPLIRRRCILACGLPRADFFIAGDDVEYALRMKRAGFSAVLVEDSLIAHEYGGGHFVRRFLWRQSVRYPQPNWKAYYQARNDTVIRLLYARRKPIAILTCILKLLRLTIGEMIYEPERVLSRSWLRTKGVVDALRGRLGRTVAP